VGKCALMSATEPNTDQPPRKAGQWWRLPSIRASFLSLPMPARLGIIFGLVATTAAIVTASFTVLGYINGNRFAPAAAPALAPKEIRFILNMGPDGISGGGLRPQAWH
jgi:hypothetical protein